MVVYIKTTLRLSFLAFTAREKKGSIKRRDKRRHKYIKCAFFHSYGTKVGKIPHLRKFQEDFLPKYPKIVVFISFLAHFTYIQMQVVNRVMNRVCKKKKKVFGKTCGELWGIS